MNTKIRVLFTVILVIGMALAVVVPSIADIGTGLFELGPSQGADITDQAGDGPDWASVFDANGDWNTAFGIAAHFLKDQLSQSNATDWTTFSGAGGSNKNNDPISPADCVSRGLPPDCDTWHWATGNTPAKDDLSNVYAYAALNPEGHLIIFAGFERLDPDGDSHVDVEFFQDPVGLVGEPPCNASTCDFSGIRSIGDFIVSMDFVRGGALGEFSIHTWNGTEYVTTQVHTGEGCNTEDTACAYNNGSIIDGGPWPNYDRHGNVITNLPKNAFTEFGVDVTELLNETPCITTFMGKTRSSQSFTAELKDFAGPGSLPICGANISIAPDDINEVGKPHTFTVTVNKLVGGVPSPVDDGTIVDVTLTDANGSVAEVSSDTCADPGTVGGICTVTFTSDTPGQVTGHASVDINFNGHIIHEETDGVDDNSGDAVKRFVDAYISIEPDDTNSVGESHTFTIIAKQNDGTGVDFINVLDGTKPSVTLSATGGAAVKDLLDTCASPGTVNGSCTVTFTSDTAGTIKGHAAITLSFTYAGQTITITRETDGTGQNSGDATKIFIAGSLSWLKKDNAGRLQGGATFRVCRTHDRFGFDIPDECVDVLDNNLPDKDSDAGEFLLQGLKLGRYTVDEISAPPGYVEDPKVVTVELTLADPNVNITSAWVNLRPILKLSEFGYTNTPEGTPYDGVVSGTTVYTIKIKNFGGTSTDFAGTLDVTTDSVGGTLVCTGLLMAISGTDLDPGEEATFTLSCDYTDLDDESIVTASLSEVEYTVNTLTRTASGTPATITFTVQSD